MTTNRRSLWLGVLLVFIVGAGSAIAGDADAVLENLAQAKDLRLVAGKDSGKSDPERFAFLVSLTRGEQTSRLVVERRGDNCALLVCSVEGLPYLYVTDGLLVKLDSTKAGQLLAVSGTRFGFTAVGDEKRGGLKFGLGIDKAGSAASSIVLDIASILRSVRPTVTKTTYDQAKRVLTLVTPKATVSLAISEDLKQDAAQYPLKSFVIGLSDGGELRFDSFRIGGDDGVIVGRRLRDFEKLQAAKVSGEWDLSLLKDQPPLPDADVWKDDKHLGASRELSKVFPDAVKLARDAGTSSNESGKGTRESNAFGAGMLSLLDGLRDAALNADLNAGQKEQVEVIIGDHRARIEATFKQLREQKISAREALAEARDLARVTDQFKKILSKEQYVTFARAWLKTVPAVGEGDPIKEMLSTIMSAARKLNLTDDQQDRLARLFLAVMQDSDCVRVGVVAGTIDAPGIRSATRRLSGQLIDGLKAVLTEQQYKQLEALIEAEIKNKPATQPATNATHRQV